ncbi:hypothetical protein JK386_03260 [Nocardioides sp. zg-536]|uniref:Uncharacterized protein n=1 Tax=Nocardioides faecalis TaxID=2803858 RepID=A0A939BUW2_9ACTN|nr:hypothetical protein [Nocardioides faecalis]MBM9458907.1 hypothetical protein [Nocardioides faecalis]MBS4753997.1 hypothetical protein [Nocardioides faecalis]QVI60309.1 hypothetical protein KG111_08520 [Nocardioides faecalis]
MSGMTGTATPFAWEAFDQPGAPLGDLVTRRVTQCALSRVCGMCAEPLGRPVAFVGTPEEIGRNAFHAPPLHVDCAQRLLAHAGAEPTWQVVTTAGFEYVRPAREDADRRARFEPNSLTG